MHVSMLVAAAAALLSTSAGAEPARPVLIAQVDAPAEKKPADSPPKKKKKARKKKSTKKPAEKKPAEAKPAEPPAQAAKPMEPPPAASTQAEAPPDVPASVPATGATTLTAPGPETAKPEPVPTSPGTGASAPAPNPDAASAAPGAQALPPSQASTAGEDNDPPALAHTPITHAPRGKSLRVEAHAADPAGVNQVILYLRRQGGSDYIPLKFVADKNAVGDYSVEVPTALMSTNLEYYIETYDNLGNGPTRAGSPERPLPIRLDEPINVKPLEDEKKVIIQQQRPPPAITHSAVNKVVKGKAIEITAKIKGPSGVSKPAVKFRQLGDSDWKSLPMGNIGEQYTATIPGSQTSRDIEYYVEAFDSSGSSAAHSASADAPFLIRVAEEEAPRPPVAAAPVKPKFVPAPFRPNPGRAAGYFALAAALGTFVFAGGEAYAAWQANENYTHTFKVEARNDPDLLKRANDYSSRAKTFAIIGAASAVVATVLLIVFPDHPSEVPAGSGGDVTLFRF
jgi:hypothetical protein